MRTIKRRTPPPVYGVGDRVATVRGEGYVTYVFPNGPHRKATFLVKLKRGRLGTIFSESEVSMIGKLAPTEADAK